MNKRKLCIITGSRSEWGLFYPLAKEISKNKIFFILQVLVTGAHLSPEFGSTYKEIKEDGFGIDRSVRMPLSGDTAEAIAGSVASGVTGITDALKKLKPDLVFLLGDRFETFSAATASLFLKVPVAHIHGGELTEGSLDDSLRHAITKMANLHFVSADAYRNRVIQMGESPKRVFNVGALALDNIRNADLFSKEELEKRNDFKFGRRNILVTFNPSTAEEKRVSGDQLSYLLKVIDELSDTKIIFTKPNPDICSEKLAGMIDAYSLKNKHKAKSFTSMGRKRYLSTLKFVDAVAGNSSSGIIEAPSFGVPTVNIGNRQNGRIRAVSIIDAGGSQDSIRNAFKKAFSEEFRKRSRQAVNPYGSGRAAEKIVKTIKKLDLHIMRKKFFDLNPTK